VERSGAGLEGEEGLEVDGEARRTLLGAACDVDLGGAAGMGAAEGLVSGVAAGGERQS
jgi:hypothetical protein